MNWLIARIRVLLGVEDSLHREELAPQVRHRIRLKASVGAAVIAGLAIIVVSIVTASISSVGRTQELPAELISSPQMTSLHEDAGLVSVLVHVAGEVVSEGLYELSGDSRVIDAVMAAGGFTENAAQCDVNLARKITDGEQILIQSLQHGCVSSQQGASGQLISLNSAQAEDFDTLPGIGPTLAARIVQFREQQGGFNAIEDLNEVPGIGDKLFAGIQKLVTL